MSLNSFFNDSTPPAPGEYVLFYPAPCPLGMTLENYKRVPGRIKEVLEDGSLKVEAFL